MNSGWIKKWTVETESERLYANVSKFKALRSQNLGMKYK